MIDLLLNHLWQSTLFTACAAMLANAARQQWPDQQTVYKSMGSLRSLSFEGGEGNATDVYLATFKNGKLRWHIEPPDAAGKVNLLFFQKVV